MLDRTAAFLADQAISVCQDATLTPHARDVRTTCLASRGAGFSSVVDQLEHGDATVVRNAPDSAWALYDPTPCSEGPIGAPTMSLALAKRIGDLHALIASQRVQDAIATGTALLADARAQHDTAAEAQIALSLAGVQDEVELRLRRRVLQRRRSRG